MSNDRNPEPPAVPKGPPVTWANDRLGDPVVLVKLKPGQHRAKLQLQTFRRFLSG